MTKRYIYLFLSIVSLFGLFTVGIFLSGINIIGGVTMGLLFYMFVIIIDMLTNLIRMEAFNKNGNILTLIFPLGLFTCRYKRIYYSDLGYFWARMYKDKVYVYNQHFLICEMLFEVYYNDDFDTLSAEIKHQLEKTFALELEEINKTKKFKSWNGYLDKQSQREGKIDQII